ncbi:unnamed protein product [Cuscuta campestris]|uniref:Uncharacterized protein n=1 Tax=Cuscuta campestris TaxID=132261 RepID=A0A484L8F0_9ASTE|nr:unnamed protein product [Cuscuta campestris]
MFGGNPTAKGWGESQSRSCEKTAVNVWGGSTSGGLSWGICRAEKYPWKTWRSAEKYLIAFLISALFSSSRP